MSETKCSESELDRVVRTVATVYGFETKWCDVLEKWIIRHEDMNCYFHWDSNKGVDMFFDDLKEYFMAIGSEKTRC